MISADRASRAAVLPTGLACTLPLAGLTSGGMGRVAWRDLPTRRGNPAAFCAALPEADWLNSRIEIAELLTDADMHASTSDPFETSAVHPR